MKQFRKQTKFRNKRTPAQVRRDRKAIHYLRRIHSERQLTKLMNRRRGIGYQLSRSQVHLDIVANAELSDGPPNNPKT